MIETIPDHSKPDNPEPRFETADEFVREYLLPMAQHSEDDFRWCRKWWLHSEAYGRLDALWRAFESYAKDAEPWAMAVWWRDYYDPIWRELTRRNGTFHGCDDSTDTHDQGRLRTADTPPTGVCPPETSISSASHQSLQQ